MLYLLMAEARRIDTADGSSKGVIGVLKKPSVHLFLILIVAAISYSNTFEVPFQFDDRYTILENPLITDFSYMPRILTGSEGRFSSRPFLHATVAVNFYFGGYNTVGYHGVNLALHLLNGILLYILVVMTGRRMGFEEKTTRFTAVCSTALLVLHPIHTETVTNIVNRSMLLATAFFLLGLILFLKAVTSDRRKPLYLAGLFFVSLLGIGSRENFSTFPLVLLLYDLFLISSFNFRETAKHWKAHLLVFLSLGYMVLLAFHHTYDRGVDYPGVGIASSDFFWTQFNVHWSYLRMLILPINQTLDYDYPISKTLLEFPTLLSFISYVALFAGSIIFAKRNPLFSFAALWFLIVLIPISFLVTFLDLRLDDVIFEHRLYLPSIGPIVAASAGVAVLISRLKSRSFCVAGATLLVVLSLVLALVSHQRNEVWRTEFTLWEDVIRKSPEKARGYNNLGMLYGAVGLNRKAIENLRAAVRLEPDYSKARFNLGLIFLQENLIAEANEQFREAVRIDPKDLQARQFLNYTLQMKGTTERRR